MNTGGVSSLIASVFMIMITISAIAVIAGVLIPFVKNKLNQSEISCIDAIGEIKIVADGSCYDSSAGESMFRVRFGNVNITQVYVIWEGEGNSESQEITIEDKFIGGGVKTFKINKKFEVARVGAIVNEKRCSISDNIELLKC